MQILHILTLNYMTLTLTQGHMILTIIILCSSMLCYIKKEPTQYLSVYLHLSCGRK